MKMRLKPSKKLAKPEVLYDEKQIASRVDELGREIGQAFAGSEPCVVGLMKSCLIFMGDLVRRIPLDLTCHFVETTSLREQGAGPVRTAIVYSTEIPYEGRDILLLDDVIDTGITLSFLLDHIREVGAEVAEVPYLIEINVAQHQRRTVIGRDCTRKRVVIPQPKAVKRHDAEFRI